jgi:D-alanine-D-alanine ligase
MNQLKILVLIHEDLVPPLSIKGYSDKEIVEWKTEFDVVSALKRMGHEAIPVGVFDDLGVIRKAIVEFEPDIAFNLLEEIHGNSLFDYHVASYLELMKLPYTGCNPRGLMIAHDKALTKKLFAFHRINTPRFCVFPLDSKIKIPKNLQYPLIVKSLVEEGSYGISQASVVNSEEKLVDRVNYLHDKLNTHVITEEYIEGREIYISIIGNSRLQTLPLLELEFGEMPNDSHNIATSKVKWDWRYQKEHKINLVSAQNIDEKLINKLNYLGKRIYKILGISGYARIDLRLTEDNKIYVLEANANPDIGYREELSTSAELINIGYEQLLHKIINFGLKYRPETSRI